MTEETSKLEAHRAELLRKLSAKLLADDVDVVGANRLRSHIAQIDAALKLFVRSGRQR